MTRTKTWLCLTAGAWISFALGAATLDTTAACTYYSALAFGLHWLMGPHE